MLQSRQASSYLLCFLGSTQRGAFLKIQKSISKALEKFNPSDCEARHTLHGNLRVA